MAINLYPEGLIGYYPQFPAVIPYHRAGSHALLTRLPLSPDRSLDHVRLACVRHAASVRSEPGSNSQVDLGSPNRPAETSRPEQPKPGSRHFTRFRHEDVQPSQTPRSLQRPARPSLSASRNAQATGP